MKKPLVAALLILAAAILLLLPRNAHQPAPASRPQDVKPGPIQAPSTGHADILALALPVDPAAFRSLAADWRRVARGDAGFRERLIRLVLDAAAPSAKRELAALVLGTLADRAGLAALAEALDAAKDPRWVKTLLLALGCDKTSGEDDDIFGLPDSPRVFETPLGLAVRIRGALDDPALRDGMIPRIREAGDAGVRWAAILALSDSATYLEVRRAFLESIPGERDPAAEGELSRALADWAAVEPAESAERSQVVTALFDGASRSDAAALRLRSEDGLKRMPWTGAEIRALASRLDGGTFDQRRWAIAVLAGAASRQETPDREFAFESLARVSGSAAEAKVREWAVTGISAFPDQARARGILIGSLGDAAWHVRAAAVRGLGRAGGTPEVLAALQRMETEDADERVRRAAAEVRRTLSPR